MDFFSTLAFASSIYNEDILDSVAEDFSSSSADIGGAIYNDGTIDSITGDFSLNSATNYGGAIYNQAEIGTISSDFANNSAEDGGAIYSQGTINSISGSFRYNSATNGGGIYNTSAGDIVSITSDFTGNTASNYGGAIYNSLGTIESIIGTFSGNTAAKGGAVYNNGGSITFSSESYYDYYYVGNYTTSYNDETGGFLYMAYDAETIFDTASSSTINIGDGTTGYDSIAGTGTITKIGEGTLTINSSLEYFEGDIYVSEGVFFTRADNLDTVSLIIEEGGALLLTSGSWDDYDNVVINGIVEIGGEVSRDSGISADVLVDEDGVLYISADDLLGLHFERNEEGELESYSYNITNDGVILLTGGTLTSSNVEGSGSFLISSSDVKTDVSINITFGYDLSDAEDYGTLSSTQSVIEDELIGSLTVGDIYVYLGSNFEEASYQLFDGMDIVEGSSFSVYYYNGALLSQYLSDGTVLYTFDENGLFTLSDKVSIFSTTLSNLYYEDACEVSSAYSLRTATSSDIFTFTTYYLDEGVYKPMELSFDVFDIDLSNGSGETYTISYLWEEDSSGNIDLYPTSGTGDFSVTYNKGNNITERQVKDSSAEDSSYDNNFIGAYYSTADSVEGGLFYNSANILEITGSFVGNHVYSTAGEIEGGVFYNYGTIGDITGSFIDNYASATNDNVIGGIFYNYAFGASASIGNITADFITSYVSGYNVYGGIIYNYTDENTYSTIGDITGSFIANSVNATWYIYGGIIYNYENAIIGDITGDFISNYAYSEKAYISGGIIYNYENVIIGDITGDFINNYAISSKSIYGGIIFNSGSTGGTPEIGDITGNFIGNYVIASYVLYGGIIYNNSRSTLYCAIIGDITGDFISNYIYAGSGVSGGIIYHESGTSYIYSIIGDVTGDFINNYVYTGSGNAYGGIFYGDGAIGDITGDFISNYVYTGSGDLSGGLIYNYDDAIIGDITGDFISNYVYTGSGDLSGGLIYNYDDAIIGDITGDFISNYAYTANGNIYGGVINNCDDATIGNIEGNFIDNSAIGTISALGGAVYNENSTLSFVASEANDYYYIGNYATIDSTVDANDDANGGFLYMDSGTANFDIATDASITIGNGTAGYDSIAGTGTINKTGDGTLNIYSSTEYFTGTLYLTEGTLNLASTFGGDLEVSDGASFNIVLTSANVGSESILLGSINLADELESFDFNISIGDYGAAVGEYVTIHNEEYENIINFLIDELHADYIEVISHIIKVADEIKLAIIDSQYNEGAATYTYTNDGTKLVNVAVSSADYELSVGDTQTINSISSDSSNFLVLDGGTLNTSSMSVNNDIGVDSTKLVINSGTINIGDTLSFESGETTVGNLTLIGGTLIFDDSTLISNDDATINFKNTYITGDFDLSGFSDINIISTSFDSIISFYDETTLTLSGTVDSSYEVGDNVILAGEVAVSSTGDSVVAVKTNNGDISLADSTTVSAIITDEDGNFLSYGTALTNAEGTNGLGLYSDGSVDVYGDVLTNSPLTVYTGDWSIKGSVDTTQNATDNDYIEIETGATLEVQGGTITTGGDSITIDGTLILASDGTSLASFVNVGDITLGADGSLEIDATDLALGSTVEIADSATTALNASIIETAIDDSGYSYIYEDSSIYFIAASYIDMLSSASSKNETTLGEALNGVAYTSDETSNIAIATLKAAIDTNGLSAYMMNASSYIAEVNTMLLSNQNFANVNRARKILEKSAGIQLDDEDGAITIYNEDGSTTVVDANDVSLIKYSNVAQLQSINLLGSKDASNGVAGYDYWSVGSTANFDEILSENALVGVSVGGTYNKVEGDAGDNANSTTFLLNAYGVYVNDGFEAFGNIGYAHFWNEGYKVGSGSADWDSDAFNALIGVSYKLETVVAGLYINPMAMFNLVYLNSDSAEYSNGVNIESQDYISAKLMLGLEVEYAITSQFNSIFRAMYAHECGDRSYDYTYGFSNVLSGIDYMGGTTARDSAVLGLSLSYDFSETCTAYFDYNAYIYDTLITHSLNFSLGIKF